MEKKLDNANDKTSDKKLIISDVNKSVCLLKYEKLQCERYFVVRTCKHCPWEQTNININTDQ